MQVPVFGGYYIDKTVRFNPILDTSVWIVL